MRYLAVIVVLGLVGGTVALLASSRDAQAQGSSPPSISAYWDGATNGPRCDFDGGSQAHWVITTIKKQRPTDADPFVVGTGDGEEYGFEWIDGSGDPPEATYTFVVQYFDFYRQPLGTMVATTSKP